jgi:hypothetical protein
MAPAQATESSASSNVGPAFPGGLLEWFWRGSALRTAKTAPKASTLRRERLRRARLAAELADRTIDPAEPLRDGSAVPLAITLFREAAYWALLAKSEADDKPSLRELLDAGKYPKPAMNEDDFALVRKALVDKTFAETADDRADTLCRDADLCQAHRRPRRDCARWAVHGVQLGSSRHARARFAARQTLDGEQQSL